MSTSLKRFVHAVGLGTATLLLVLLVMFGLELVGWLTNWSFNPIPWFIIERTEFWRGRYWTILTHAFLPAGIPDLLFNGLMLAMLGTWIERVWSKWELWAFCLIAALATGGFKVLLGGPKPLYGTLPLVLGLLVVWARLFGHERVLFMGIWDMTVRQCAGVIAGIDVIIMATSPCFGLGNCLSVCMAAVAGWIYLTLRWKVHLAAPSRVTNTDRIHRLEL